MGVMDQVVHAFAEKLMLKKSHDNAYALCVCVSDAYQKCNFEHAAMGKRARLENKKLQKINKITQTTL